MMQRDAVEQQVRMRHMRLSMSRTSAGIHRHTSTVTRPKHTDAIRQQRLST